MQIIKTSKSLDNYELERRFTLYLSRVEMVSMVRALMQIAIANELDPEEEAKRKDLFSELSEHTQKTVICLVDDMCKVL